MGAAEGWEGDPLIFSNFGRSSRKCIFLPPSLFSEGAQTTVPAASRQSTGRLRVPPPHDALQRDHTPTRQPKSPQGRSKHRRMDVGSGLPGRTHLSFGTTAGVDPSVATPQQRNGVRRMAPAHVWRVNTYHWLVARKSQFAAACQPRTPPSRPPRHLSPIRTQAAIGMAH